MENSRGEDERSGSLTERGVDAGDLDVAEAVVGEGGLEHHTRARRVQRVA